MPQHSDWNRLVNSKWPADMATPTEQEAISGARRLYRKAMGRPWRGKIKVTSGNRYTYIRGGTMYVNPDETRFGERGWRGIVHGLSHYCHRRLHPEDTPHSERQLYLERDLVDHVIAKGWHLGALKREPKAKPPRDIVAERAARIDARIAKWETKKKRAETALKKLRKQQKYYAKKTASAN